MARTMGDQFEQTLATAGTGPIRGSLGDNFAGLSDAIRRRVERPSRRDPRTGPEQSLAMTPADLRCRLSRYYC
jgi:hypothetical protein